MSLIDVNEIAAPAKQKQSPLGVTSFILAMIYILVVGGVLAIVVAMENGSYGDSANTAVFFALAVIVGALLNLVGLGLGIGALFQKKYKKGLAIAGTVINGVFLLGLLFLVIIGLSLSSRW